MLTLKFVHMVKLIIKIYPCWTFFQGYGPLKCYAQKAYTLEIHFNLCEMIALISPNRLIFLSAAGVGSQNSPFRRTT